MSVDDLRAALYEALDHLVKCEEAERLAERSIYRARMDTGKARQDVEHVQLNLKVAIRRSMPTYDPAEQDA